MTAKWAILIAQLVFDQDEVIIAALRRGDEQAFSYLVDRYHAAMVRVATLFCRDQNVAEEVVQETWIAVLKGSDKFESRSSLKTWIFSIVSNKAKTRGVRESRSVTFSDLAGADEEATAVEATVDPARFKEDGWWVDATHPNSWATTPDTAYQSSEVRAYIQQAIESLPLNQRWVITYRDIEGWSSQEVCNVLDVSETNQRVLLHRARAKVRSALEHYFDEQYLP